MSIYDATTWTTESLYDACFEVYMGGGISAGGTKGNDGFALFDFSSKNMLLGFFGTSLYKMDKTSAGTPDGVWDNVPGGSSWDSYTKLMLHGDGTDHWYFAWDGTTTLTFAVVESSSNIILVNKAASISTLTWYHIALVRYGNIFRIFVDGVQQGTDVTDADAFPNYTGVLKIGDLTNG